MDTNAVTITFFIGRFAPANGPPALRAGWSGGRRGVPKEGMRRSVLGDGKLGRAGWRDALTCRVQTDRPHLDDGDAGDRDPDIARLRAHPITIDELDGVRDFGRILGLAGSVPGGMEDYLSRMRGEDYGLNLPHVRAFRIR